MINKRLINTVDKSKKYIAFHVIAQVVSLIANIIVIFTLGFFLEKLFTKELSTKIIFIVILIAIITILIRFTCSKLIAKMSFLASKSVKLVLRDKIYQKLLKLGNRYNEKVSSAEVVQVSVEGVDQLETYFGGYLPQFFYSMIAPLILFVVLSFVSFKAAIVLLICVPLIPISIALVQTFAKKLLSKYWGKYTSLGDTFLENLQGLTTLKIYQADEIKNKKMNEEAESFRKITMKVLVMQLNSITIMDLVAYGGAALGVIFAASEFNSGAISLMGCFAIILLSADFFIPMRQLGSFFHIAMNGMAASDKIFRLLDIEEPIAKNRQIDKNNYTVKAEKLSFSYDNERMVLKAIDFTVPMKGMVAIVGESGCGKSTIAGILTGRNTGYISSIKIGGIELSDINEKSLMESIVYISHKSYLFKGSVRENLLMGRASASDSELWTVLDRTNLSSFLRQQQGLDTELSERGANLSGGQRQRLALARALLHDASVYIFDEATSNIDVESENLIMNQIYSLSNEKAVIVISHRIANIIKAENILVMDKGEIKEVGKHLQLLNKKGIYSRLWNTQQDIETLGMGAII
ncbi:MAG: ABC transporter ATP-binding protein/permease [Clostridiales bacterium]|nr:ABC transporter ATP-binding protein/permease [Clostridiales bacterium]